MILWSALKMVALKSIILDTSKSRVYDNHAHFKNDICDNLRGETYFWMCETDWNPAKGSLLSTPVFGGVLKKLATSPGSGWALPRPPREQLPSPFPTPPYESSGRIQNLFSRPSISRFLCCSNPGILAQRSYRGFNFIKIEWLTAEKIEFEYAELWVKRHRIL